MSHLSSKFKNTFFYDSNINNIISFYYDKKILKQPPECIVCIYNGQISYTNASTSTKLILKFAGEDLIRDLIKKTENKNSAHIGGIIVTKGFNYPACHLFHIVAPTFVPKYANAAYSKLNYMYRHILNLTIELNIESIGIPCLHKPYQGFAGTEGARIALRTIRRFLENLKDFSCIKNIILIVPKKSDKLIYSELMPIYFPCNEFEERLSLDLSKCELCESEDQPLFYNERDIRIHPSVFSSLQDLSAYKYCGSVDKSFLKMRSNFDRDRIQSLRRQRKNANFIKQKTSYKLNHFNTQLSANTVDEFANPRMLYRGGRDALGFHVVVFVASHFPKIISRSFASWFTHRLIDLVNEKYCLVYLQTSTHWIPTTECLRTFYSQIDPRFFTNLTKIYVLHADRSVQIKSWLSLPNEIFKRIKFIRGVEDLYAFIPSHQITLPQLVLDYDFKINGIRYYTGPVADLPS